RAQGGRSPESADGGEPAPALLEPHRLTDANPGLSDRVPARASIHRWTAEDGTELETQLFIPRGRPGPHPLVVIPYGGYTAGFPESEYFLDLGVLPLVSRGWAVVRPNTRGRAGDTSPVGRYGEIQLVDTHALVDDLAAAGIVDPARVAVIGHSHGGSMAHYYLTHSDRFCAVTAINGRADWIAQAEHGDGYLVNAMGGSPDELPDLYAAASPVANVDAVTAPLLAIAGRRDTQIPAWNAESMVSSLTERGHSAELLVFEEEGHLFANAENRRRIWDRIFALLDRACVR
ncbi:MAG: alpha/beta hydrolase family protein, partial [Gemmatimonadota bacterium]